jgi:chorismate synthase
MPTSKTLDTADHRSPAGCTPYLPGEVTIRPLRSHHEFRECVEIQKQTWGEQFSECVPPTILKVCQRIGGVAAGAFDTSGRLLGFVFGMTGIERGEIVHWSDMLAVRPEARNLGLGQKLKQFQADTLRELGVSRIYWTYDPLVARNAHLNLNKLGAEVVEYVVDMYGDTEAEMHRLGTDRFIVAWRIAPHQGSDAVLPDLPALTAGTPVLNAAVGDGGISDLDDPVVRVEVPVSIDAVQRVSLEEAERWRATTRAALVWAQDQGYRVTGFFRETDQGPCYYVLTRPHNTRARED